MDEVEFSHLYRTYPGSSYPTIRDVTFTVPSGQMLVLFGPTSAGKSTIVRMLAGLEDVDRGRISIGGRDVTGLPASERDIAMVFHNYALYPHMSVADNMGFALKVAGMDADQVTRRVQHAAEILGLVEHLDDTPHNLSAAQRQQIALGRAMVRQPRVFVLDEPLSNLEEPLHQQVRAQITQLQHHYRVTTLYATSSAADAVAMDALTAVLDDGQILQVGRIDRLRQRPVSQRVRMLLNGAS